MKITASVIAQIQSARKALGLNQSELAERVGLDRSTVSKLLSGQINIMKPEMVDVFNDALKLDLMPLRVADEEVSPTLVALSRAARNDAALSDLLENILSLTKIDPTPFLPDIPTKDLAKIGAGISQIAQKWEGPMAIIYRSLVLRPWTLFVSSTSRTTIPVEHEETSCLVGHFPL